MKTKLKISDINNLFTSNFIDSKAFFIYCFNKAPCITYINKVRGEQVLKCIMEEYATAILGIYQYSWFNWTKKRPEFNDTIVVLRDNCIVEVGINYCEILYARENYDKVTQLIKELTRFKAREKKKNFEINLVVKDGNGVELKPMEIKKTKLDLSLYYEDEFLETDRIIKERLNRRQDKGIVLLYGLPGTGKTTYLRYLIGRLKKKVLFLSPSMADNIMDPSFVDLLIDNPNCVVIIEDAENILLDRKVSRYSSVSNILNISDGLLADFLNVQVICTFNQSISLIDGALLRKGRLIASYEFGRLNVSKAQKLSDHLGFKTVINRPMTLAEIAAQNERNEEVQKVEVIGFRRTMSEN